MKTEKELNSDILKLIMVINEKHPELSKYINEMQVTLPDRATPEINVKHLQNYYDSLNDLLNKYVANHKNTTKREFFA